MFWAYATYDPSKAIAAFGEMEKHISSSNFAHSKPFCMLTFRPPTHKKEDALKVLVKMKKEYNLEPNVIHFGYYMDTL